MNVCNITDIFSLLHKVFYQNNYIHSLCFGDLIFEAKGVRVMLKILSEQMPFYETPLIESKLSISHNNFQKVDLRSKLCLNILYLIFNISFSIKSD